jgi:hypothetical protein
MQPINSHVVGWELARVKKLLNLKQWLSVADAARHLSLLFGEDVTELDVLRLALDGHLTLSAHLVNKRECLCGPLVQIQDAKRDTQALDKNSQHPIVGVSAPALWPCFPLDTTHRHTHQSGCDWTMRHEAW